MAPSSEAGATATMTAAPVRRARLQEPGAGPRADPAARRENDGPAAPAGRPGVVVAVMPAPRSRSGGAARTPGTAVLPGLRLRAARARAPRAGTGAPLPRSPTPRSPAS